MLNIKYTAITIAFFALCSCSKEEPEIFIPTTWTADEFYIENNKPIHSKSTIYFQTKDQLTITRKGTSTTSKYKISDSVGIDTLFIDNEILIMGEYSIVSDFPRHYYIKEGFEDKKPNYRFLSNSESSYMAFLFCEFIDSSVCSADCALGYITVYTSMNIDDNVDYDYLFSEFTKMSGHTMLEEKEYTYLKNEYGYIDIHVGEDIIGYGFKSNFGIGIRLIAGTSNFSIIRKNIIERLK